jgi:hypothetical protein
MKHWDALTCTRREFVGLAAGLATAWAGTVRGEDRPEAARPRAISGDRAEPDWQERLTVTVGPRKADLVGTTDKVLQAAVDYVARLGGGTVRVLPGTYRLRNAVYLRSRVRLLGSGADSVLVKEASVITKLAADSDWYDQEITLADARGFQVGDGVCLRARNPHTGGPTVIKRTLVARSGKRFKLDRALRENLWEKGEPTASSLFPILSGENVANVMIEDITLDGNKANNDNLNGNYAGCVFLQDCKRIRLRGVTARSYNGDGISWQVCHDVHVENCHSHDHAGLGLHPGSGSQRPVIRGNQLRRNDIGIFFCWGVRYGLAEKNRVEDNRIGVSIGHRDTDNLIRDNAILRSGQVGVLFRAEPAKGFSADRNRLENNRIADSGPAKGVAVDVQGQTDAVTIARNDIRETRQPLGRIGVRLGAQTGAVKLADNKIEGFAVTVADLRKR